jgi:maltose/moltooligosaccharide transporter
MWVYFSPAVAKKIFHAAPGSPEMEAAGAWVGFYFEAYNAVCFGFSFVLLWATKHTGPKVMHILCPSARSVSPRCRWRPTKIICSSP